jgi:hypothetical protein
MFRLKGARDLRQRDALERTDHVVRAFFREEAFVIPGTEVPVRTLVIIIAIKAPDTADDDETTDPVIPVIANIMKAQVRAREGASETGVIENNDLRQTDRFLGRLDFHLPGGAGVITERAECPFCVNDAAVIGRQFNFCYSWHKRVRRWFRLI